MPNRLQTLAVLVLGLAAAVQTHASGEIAAAPVALSPVTVNSYPAPMLEVDGSSKYVAVVASRGVEIHRCQHMVVTSLNYLACEVNDGDKSYNVVIPIVREAMDIRQPWAYMKPGVYTK